MLKLCLEVDDVDKKKEFECFIIRVSWECKGKVLSASNVERRCHSLSPVNNLATKSLCTPVHKSSNFNSHQSPGLYNENSTSKQELVVDLPNNVKTKISRTLAVKKREFLTMRKHYMSQQSSLIEQATTLKDLETRVGMKSDDSLGEIRVLTLKRWPMHDLLMLIPHETPDKEHSDICGVLGPQVLLQVQEKLIGIPQQVLKLGGELMKHRQIIISILRTKHRNERVNYQTNQEWKSKNIELDKETEQLNSIIADVANKLRTKINCAIDLAKISWLDREALIKKLDNSRKENFLVQQKLEEIRDEQSRTNTLPPADVKKRNQVIGDELKKETMKEVTPGIDSMLRLSRNRITTLERELKDTRTELEVAHRKINELDQMFRHREATYESRIKKFTKKSKTEETTIDVLYKQRDVLESRVKELREQYEIASRNIECKEEEIQQLTNSLKLKTSELEKLEYGSERKVIELEAKIVRLEEDLRNLNEKSSRLVDAQKRLSIDILPSREAEPTNREADLWRELQITRQELDRCEHELNQSRANKDKLLNTLSKVTGNTDCVEENLSLELFKKEELICKLQKAIEDHHHNNKIMNETLAEYENKIQELRFENKRLRNYECYSKENKYQDFETELLELHAKVASLTQEHSSLISTAASRGLMLERHERAAEEFANIIRLRYDLNSLLNGDLKTPVEDDVYSSLSEISEPLYEISVTGAETWSALQIERAKVLRLEKIIIAQNQQLEREGRMRIQLEHRRSVLEREIQTNNILQEQKLNYNPTVSHEGGKLRNTVIGADYDIASYKKI